MSRRLAAPLALTAAGTLVALGLSVPPASSAQPKPLSFRRTVLQDQKAYGEPSLAVSADGKHIAVCVPGGAGQTSVWYSSDDGRTFGTSHTTSTNGGGDCEIDFLPNNTLINADLEVYDSAIRLSTDFGKTWHGTQTAGVEQDRQWFAHSKDGKKVFLVYHDFAAEGEFYAESDDGGLTWPTSLGAQPVNGTDQVALPGLGAARPGDAASLVDQGGNTFSGPMLLGPGGDKYVLYSISDAKSNATEGTPPYGPTRGIVVAHMGPEDGAFTNKYAVTSDGTAANGAIFPWGSVDQAGNVYLFYNSDRGAPGHFHTYYVYSTDKAAHWSQPIKVDDVPLGRGAQVYSTGDAGADGVIDLAWYGENGVTGTEGTNSWDLHFAQVRGAHSAHPSITRALVAPGDPLHKGSVCLSGLLCVTGGDRSLLDFFELVIGKDGLAQIAYADNAGTFSGTKGRVVWAKQVGGRSALDPSGVAPAAKPPAAKPPVAVTKPVATPSAGATRGLASTGLDRVLPASALLLLLAVALLRRRRANP
jgi:hypothetical protein